MRTRRQNTVSNATRAKEMDIKPFFRVDSLHYNWTLFPSFLAALLVWNRCTRSFALRFSLWLLHRARSCQQPREKGLSSALAWTSLWMRSCVCG